MILNGDCMRGKKVKHSYGRFKNLLPLIFLSSLPPSFLPSISPAAASVAFDPDRYGDKELKIATVNKLKQKLRNAIAGDLTLAVPFVRLAINDGREEGRKGGREGRREGGDYGKEGEDV